jgi:hypothetical protein
MDRRVTTNLKRLGINMGMKSSDAPRRLYVIGGRVHALLGGKLFAPTNSSKFTATSLVILTPLPSDGGRARVQVQTQWGSTVEVWRSVKREPRRSRAVA